LEEKIEVLIREEDNFKIILTKNIFGINKLIFFQEGKKKTTLNHAKKLYQTILINIKNITPSLSIVQVHSQ